MPEKMTEVPLSSLEAKSVAAAIAEVGLVPSLSEARRKISQGGVRVDGRPVTDVNYPLQAAAGTVLQVGKRHFVRLV
jgi:tyrosyl-tRNA synthetase